MTKGEAETKRQKAVEFLRRIGNDDLAEEFEDMTPESYAEHKGAELLENPYRRPTMTRTKSKAAVEAELAEANEYIEELEAKLDDIAGIASEDEEEEDDDTTQDDDQGEE